jgi:hypothetical protein
MWNFEKDRGSEINGCFDSVIGLWIAGVPFPDRSHCGLHCGQGSTETISAQNEPRDKVSHRGIKIAPDTSYFSCIDAPFHGRSPLIFRPQAALGSGVPPFKRAKDIFALCLRHRRRGRRMALAPPTAGLFLHAVERIEI